MQNLISLIKADFVTVRDLEKKSFTLFAYAGGSFLIGVLCFLTAVLVAVGIPLMVLGVVLFFISMVWISVLSKKPAWDIYCPHCSSRNHVFKPRCKFECDICGKEVLINENGEAFPADLQIERKVY